MRKMYKRILALACVLTSMFALASCGNTEQENTTTQDIQTEQGNNDTVVSEAAGGLHFMRISGKQEYRVVGLGLYEEPDVIIPDTYKGLPVTEIGREAFGKNNDSCAYITSIKIGENVTRINEVAFAGCERIAEIFIPIGVTEIQASAFSQCNSNAIIYCEAETQPEGWDTNWNPHDLSVEWGATSKAKN